MRIAICLLLTAAAAWAQPKVTAVAQGADFSTTLAPGTLASVVGSGFAPSAVSASTVPLPTTLSGVTVNVNGKPAPLTFANASQINFQLPVGTPPGTASLTVTSGTQTSAAANFTVAASAPGVFQYGAAHGVIQNQDYSLNSATNRAAAGSVVTVYLTGIGVTNPAVADGNVAPSTAPLATPLSAGRATIAGVNAPVLFLGLTPGNVGLAQANIQIPPLVSDGDYPLVIQLGGASSKPVIISARATKGAALPNGATCLSGEVESVTFSLQFKSPGLADEVVIDGTRLCPKCDVKPPIYPEFVAKLEEARTTGVNVDLCYDAAGASYLVRMRP